MADMVQGNVREGKVGSQARAEQVLAGDGEHLEQRAERLPLLGVVVQVLGEASRERVALDARFCVGDVGWGRVGGFEGGG